MTVPISIWFNFINAWHPCSTIFINNGLFSPVTVTTILWPQLFFGNCTYFKDNWLFCIVLFLSSFEFSIVRFISLWNHIDLGVSPTHHLHPPLNPEIAVLVHSNMHKVNLVFQGSWLEVRISGLERTHEDRYTWREVYHQTRGQQQRLVLIVFNFLYIDLDVFK